jgi:hypothetical protein
MSAITDKFAMTVEISTANNTPRNTCIRNRMNFSDSASTAKIPPARADLFHADGQT